MAATTGQTTSGRGRAAPLNGRELSVARTDWSDARYQAFALLRIARAAGGSDALGVLGAGLHAGVVVRRADQDEDRRAGLRIAVLARAARVEGNVRGEAARVGARAAVRGDQRYAATFRKAHDAHACPIHVGQVRQIRERRIGVAHPICVWADPGLVFDGGGRYSARREAVGDQRHHAGLGELARPETFARHG